jgi:hypothetical protein
MLSATSDDNYTTNSTDTEQLKNKLLNIAQDGGTEKGFFDSLLSFFNPPVVLKPEIKAQLLEDERNEKTESGFLKTLGGVQFTEDDKTSHYYIILRNLYYASNEEKLKIYEEILKNTKENEKAGNIPADISKKIIDRTNISIDETNKIIRDRGY